MTARRETIGSPQTTLDWQASTLEGREVQIVEQLNNPSLDRTIRLLLIDELGDVAIEMMRLLSEAPEGSLAERKLDHLHSLLLKYARAEAQDEQLGFLSIVETLQPPKRKRI